MSAWVRQPVLLRPCLCSKKRQALSRQSYANAVNNSKAQAGKDYAIRKQAKPLGKPADSRVKDKEAGKDKSAKRGNGAVPLAKWQPGLEAPTAKPAQLEPSHG